MQPNTGSMADTTLGEGRGTRASSLSITIQDRKHFGNNGRTSTYINRALYPKSQDLPNTSQLSMCKVGRGKPQPKQSWVSSNPPSPGTTCSFPGAVTGQSPYYAEVYAIGDGVSPVFRTSPLMPLRVSRPWMAAISLGLPRSLSITTCNRGKSEAISCLQPKPPCGHFYGTIHRMVLQMDVAGSS